MDREAMSVYASWHRPDQGDLTATNRRYRPSRWRRIVRAILLAPLWPLSALTRAMGAWLRRIWLPTPHDNDPLEFVGFDWPTPKPHREWNVRHE